MLLRLFEGGVRYLAGQDDMQISYDSLQARRVSVLKPTTGPLAAQLE